MTFVLRTFSYLFYFSYLLFTFSVNRLCALLTLSNMLEREFLLQNFSRDKVFLIVNTILREEQTKQSARSNLKPDSLRPSGEFQNRHIRGVIHHICRTEDGLKWFITWLRALSFTLHSWVKLVQQRRQGMIKCLVVFTAKYSCDTQHSPLFDLLSPPPSQPSCLMRLRG